MALGSGNPGATALVATALGPGYGFNWIFLVELLTIGVLTLFFLLYFNRVFATVVSYGIRAISWKLFGVYIDIQAIQISLLGGRIFFKGVQYHGQNVTLLVHEGHITWRYWLRTVRDAEIFLDDENPASQRSTDDSSSTGHSTLLSGEGGGDGRQQRVRSVSVSREERGGKRPSSNLPCRIRVNVRGVEAFLYNRTPAYDAIFDAFMKQEPKRTSDSSPSEIDSLDDVNSPATDRRASVEQAAFEHLRQMTTGTSMGEKSKRHSSDKHGSGPSSPPFFLKIFPIAVEAKTGSLSLGNENTTSIITARFELAKGVFDAGKAGPLDSYKQIFSFDVDHPVVRMRPNPDFKELSLEAAARLKQHTQQDAHEQAAQGPQRKHVTRSALYSRLRHLMPGAKASQESLVENPHKLDVSVPHLPTLGLIPGQPRWQGLHRYFEQDQDEHDEWEPVEYGKSSLLADITAVSLTFFWDVGGPARLGSDDEHADPTCKDINGSTPPDYGMDLTVRGGTVNYGPWADRQRISIQQVYFPPMFCDSHPAKKLRNLETRVATVFKLFLVLEDEVVLRLPFRESSKDWRWKGKAEDVTGKDKNRKVTPHATIGRRMPFKKRNKRDAASNVRPFGWMDIKVKADTSVSYTMDMVAGRKGYGNSLALDVSTIDITSSVNHDLLLRTGRIGVTGDLPNPLQWNAPREWKFGISCNDIELFILRDHLFLLMDLIADWSAGPPPAYHTFIPLRYLLNLDIRGLRMHINTNTSNIINNPTDFEDNHFVDLYGRHLLGNVVIPMDRYRPVQNAVTFDLDAHDLGFEMRVPPKNTIHTFVANKDLVQLNHVTLSGSHNYWSDQSPELSDTLLFDIHGAGLTGELYGFFARHLVQIKENYFGDTIHFRTLEEVQGGDNRPKTRAGEQELDGPTIRENDLDVILYITAVDVNIKIPSSIYSCDEFVRLNIASATVDLRVNNYYLDMQVDSSPIAIASGDLVAGRASPIEDESGTQIFIESANVAGHRLMGLPREEPAYAATWSVDVGDLKGECSSKFLARLVGAGLAFAFSFQDFENSVTIEDPIPTYDVTFLALKTGNINIWFHAQMEAFLAHTGPISINFSDWADEHFSQRLTVLVPEVVLLCCDAKEATRFRSRQEIEDEKIPTHAFLETDVRIDMVARSAHFAEACKKQQDFLWTQDQRSLRTGFLLHHHEQRRPTQAFSNPSLKLPSFPFPVMDREAGSVTRRKPKKASLPTRVASAQQARPYSADVIRGDGMPSGLAFSSPYANPVFELDSIQADLSDVPERPVIDNEAEDLDDSDSVIEDVAEQTLDPSADHMSFTVTIASGLRILVKPKAIFAASNLADAVLPRDPQGLLDDTQMSVISKILAQTAALVVKGSSVDVGVNLPTAQIRVLAPNEDASLSKRSLGDQCDLILQKVALLLRINNVIEASHTKLVLSVHTTMQRLRIALTDRLADASQRSPWFHINLDDTLLWLVSGNFMTANLSFRDFETAMTTKNPQYLSEMALRMEHLVLAMIERFEAIKDDRTARLRFLVYYLTDVGRQSLEPAFLTRATWRLRGSVDQLRNQDSWKLLGRIRHILHTLDDDQRAELKQAFASHDRRQCPENAQDAVFDILNEWRNWDLSEVKETYAVRAIYGNVGDVKELNPRELIPFNLAVRAASIKVIIDPGYMQTQIALYALAIAATFVPPQTPTGLMLLESRNQRPLLTLQANAKKTDIVVTWEILNVCDIALGFLADSKSKPVQEEQSPQKVAKRPTAPPLDVHLVANSEIASIQVQAINVQFVAKARHMKNSIVIKDDEHGKNRLFVSALANADTATTELLGHDRVFWHSRIESPSLSIIFSQGSRPVQDTFRVAGAIDSLLFEIKESVRGILDVADRVLLDEVVSAKKRVESFEKVMGPSSPEAPAATPPSQPLTTLPRIFVAMFMSKYTVTVAFLPSLAYSLEGKPAGLSVAPQAFSMSTLNVDFDVQTQTHRLLNLTRSHAETVAQLEFPPINGRVNVHQAKERITIGSRVTIEQTKIDAAAIQGIIATVNRPEVLKAFEATQEDVQAFKSHIEQAFPKSESLALAKVEPDSQIKSPEIAFDVRVTLARIAITASAHDIPPNSSSAKFTIGLDSIQLTAYNKDPTSDQLLLLPEVKGHLRNFALQLESINQRTIPCGNVQLSLLLHCTSQIDSDGEEKRHYALMCAGIEVNLFAETASTVIDIVNHLQDRAKELDFTREVEYIRKLRHARNKSIVARKKSIASPTTTISEVDALEALESSTFLVEISNIQIAWVVGAGVELYGAHEIEDLVLSLARIEVSKRTKRAAALIIEDLQLQLAPRSVPKSVRSRNYVLLPEVAFNVTYTAVEKARHFNFRAAGKSLEVCLQSYFILPASVLEKSMTDAMQKVREATVTWSQTPSVSGTQRKGLFGSKTLGSLVVDADFAGAVVYLQRNVGVSNEVSLRSPIASERIPQQGRYGQFADEEHGSTTTLRTPGLALKVEYHDDKKEPTLAAEIKIESSSNTIYPTLVPWIMEISKGMQAVVRESDTPEATPAEAKMSASRIIDGEMITAGPSALLGKTKLDLGFRICKQEFTLTCQPFAKVTASAQMEDMYLTVNTIRSSDQGHFFAVSLALTKLQTAVRHVYSRESTFSFDIDSVTLCLMNSKHLNGNSGVSTMLKFDPMRAMLNAKQLQDFLLFREIWFPAELQGPPAPPPTASFSSASTPAPTEHLMAKYQQIASTAAFPWNASVAFEHIALDLDLGQGVGKATFHISDLWASSTKDSDWEQNLTLGISSMGISSTGRMSGLVDLSDLKVRTSINWPQSQQKTPLIQASVGFGRMRLKAAWDYQLFAISDIEGFNFLMYNVRDHHGRRSTDRLVAMLNGNAVQAFITATSASQAIALYQAFERLIQEQESAFKSSLRDIETSLRRQSIHVPARNKSQVALSPSAPSVKQSRTTISLHTDVMVSLQNLNVGVFPNTFFDQQVLKVETTDVQARFAVTVENGKLHTGLGMTLGELRVALSNAQRTIAPKNLDDVTVDEIVQGATGSRGGTILKVPRLVARMHTWQIPSTNTIEYTFSSIFEGKVDVGWNYSRISYIRGMWNSHSRALASRLGKPMPEPAVKITTTADEENAKDPDSPKKDSKGKSQEKIMVQTAMPLSKYEYTALEPPVIDTPHLRDLGEATPPLEWMGLHRDKLPHVMHQVVVVTLLEVAKEVEDAYTRILGSS